MVEAATVGKERRGIASKFILPRKLKISHMNSKRILTAIALGSFFTLGTLPATAAVVATKGIDGSVVVSGLTNYGSYVVEYSGTPKVRRVSANACGVVSLRSSTSFPITSTSSLTRSGTSYLMSDLPVGATPKCSNGTLAEAPAASVFKDSNGAVYFTGLTAYSSAEIAFNSIPATRRAKANACGMLSIRNNSLYPLSTTPIVVKNYSDTGSGLSVLTFTPSTLTSSDAPVCRQGKAYFPEGWSSGSSGSGNSGN